jgi:hypothetical protein
MYHIYRSDTRRRERREGAMKTNYYTTLKTHLQAKLLPLGIEPDQNLMTALGCTTGEAGHDVKD